MNRHFTVFQEGFAGSRGGRRQECTETGWDWMKRRLTEFWAVFAAGIEEGDGRDVNGATGGCDRFSRDTSDQNVPGWI